MHLCLPATLSGHGQGRSGACTLQANTRYGSWNYLPACSPFPGPRGRENIGRLHFVATRCYDWGLRMRKSPRTAANGPCDSKRTTCAQMAIQQRTTCTQVPSQDRDSRRNSYDDRQTIGFSTPPITSNSAIGQILMKKLSSPSLGCTILRCMIGSAQLTLILSTVAGDLRLKTSSLPYCFLAAFSASRMAKKTALPMNNGGSPTPRDRWMVRRCSQFTSFSNETLNSCGISRKPGI